MHASSIGDVSTVLRSGQTAGPTTTTPCQAKPADLRPKHNHPTLPEDSSRSQLSNFSGIEFPVVTYRTASIAAAMTSTPQAGVRITSPRTIVVRQHAAAVEKWPGSFPHRPLPLLPFNGQGLLTCAPSAAAIKSPNHFNQQWLFIYLGWNSQIQLTSPMPLPLQQYLFLLPLGWGVNKDADCFTHIYNMLQLPCKEEVSLTSF